MKYNKINISLPMRILGIFMLLGLFLIPAQADDNKPSMQNDKMFQVTADGTIQVDGYTFKNFTEYFQSDYFKKSGRRCKTTIERDIQKDAPLGSTSDCTLYKTAIRNEYWPSGTYVIPVVFHVIYRTDGTGNISDQRINDQVKVLNQDFRAISGTMGEDGNDTKIQFELAGITRTANNTWFNDFGEYQFKNTLGWDQDRYFNVYTNSAGGYLGYSYLPQDMPSKVYDGVVVLYETVGDRGDGPSPYDLGRTLVHETGHYLGLLHTFEDYGCYSGYQAGDLIDDTNSENDEHYGCSQTYSCGTMDPIHNYMNYTDDDCMWEFTSEQANRLVCSLVNYRPLLYEIQGSQASISVTSPNGGESWSVGSTHTITWSSTGTVGNVKIEYTANNGSSWSTVVSSTANDGAYTWKIPNTPSNLCKVRIKEASDGSPSDTSNSVFSITSGGSSGNPSLSLNRSALYFTSLSSGSKTSAQEVWVSNSGDGTLNWTLSDNASWLSCSPTSGTNSGVVTVWVTPTTMSSGTYSAVISVSASGASNSPQSVGVTLTVKNSSQDQSPFGEFATPSNNTSVMGSIPVTGWVLDDVEVQSVKIYSGSSYIGDGVFVEGARPDVEQAYPAYPKNYRAGWGYMLLTNVLTDGNRSISVVATDNTGHQVSLGTRTIKIDNANLEKPFGAMDSPAQGGMASGKKYRNQGWALTPQPNKIPIDGSTIKLYVDGQYKGTANYNIYRADIAALFPGYTNSNGALAYFELDTTGYDDGLHTIQWTATDNGGNSDGIGSRFFTILNSTRNSQSNTQTELPHKFPSRITNQLEETFTGNFNVKIGYDQNTPPQTIYPDEKHQSTVTIKELERLVIDLGTPGWSGRQEIVDGLKSLPVGSSWDKEHRYFYWIPGPAFLGDYPLVFFNNENGEIQRITVRILPKY